MELAKGFQKVIFVLPVCSRNLVDWKRYADVLEHETILSQTPGTAQNVFVVDLLPRGSMPEDSGPEDTMRKSAGPKTQSNEDF